MGKLVIHGPLILMEEGEIRGIGGLEADSLAQAAQPVRADPMARAGRPLFEIHPWMAGKGIPA